MNLGQLVKQYQWPLLIVGGALAAYSAMARRSDPGAGGAPVTVVPAVGGAGMTPDQTLALVKAGGEIAVAGQQTGVQIAAGGLSLAEAATSGSQLITQVALGNVGGAVQTLGDLAGKVVAALPDLSPTPPPPPATPTPAPPGATPAPVFIGYWFMGRGSIGYYLVASNCGLTRSGGAHTTDRYSQAPVERGTCGGRVFWRITSGGYRGRAAVAGLTSGDWHIVKRYRRADGSTSDTRISATGA